MFFIIIKGTVGKEVFLTDLEGWNSIQESFMNDRNYSFVAYNPKDLNESSFVNKKNGTVFGFEVRPSNV